MGGSASGAGTVRDVTAPTHTAPTDEVPVRPAATVMIIRDADGSGLEVFMLRRTLNAAFASGMYVFPGGRVETADGADVEQAHRLAAIRECFEEAGILLAHTPGTFETITDGHAALAQLAFLPLIFQIEDQGYDEKNDEDNREKRRKRVVHGVNGSESDGSIL